MMIGMGMVGAGALMKGLSAKAHGAAAKRADYLSADEAERAAADAIDKGNLKEMQVGMHGSATIAAERVLQSGTGADVNVGGPLAAQEAVAAVSAVDRAVVRRNAALEAYGLKSRARAFRQQGENAEAAGNAEMVGTFLGGIGTIASMGGKFAGDRVGADENPVSSQSDPRNWLVERERV